MEDELRNSININRVLMFVLVIAIGAAGYFFNQKIEAQLEENKQLNRMLLEELKRVETLAREAHFSLCNGTPYNIWAITVHPTSSSSYKIKGHYELSAGECYSYTHEFVGYEREFFVHAVASVDDKLAWFDRSVTDLSEADRPSLTSGQKLYFHGESDLIFCVDPTNIIEQTVDKTAENECEENFVLAGFTKAGRKEGSYKNWTHVFEHPDWSLGEVNPQAPAANLLMITQRAKDLSKSVDKQMEAEAHFKRNKLPVLFGATLLDVNSKLNPGLLVDNVIQNDLFGVPQQLQNGDIITSVNGHKVFSKSEAFYHLVVHSESLKHGIDIPVKLKVIRNECPNGCLIGARYFFNQEVLYRPDEIAAGYYGFSDMVFFGAGATGNCVIGQIGKLAGNLFFGAVEGIDAAINERPFDADSLKIIEYHNMERCRWNLIQKKAYAQQVHRDYYDNAAYLGVITPGGFRALFGKAATKNATKVVGRGAMARGLASATLEIAETTLWSVGSAAPGTPITDRLKTALQLAPIGAGAGFATGTIFGPRKKRK